MINLRSLSLLALKANPPKADRASRLRIARSVAVLVSLFMGMGLSNADSTSIDAIQPKPYIRSILSHEQALCLIKLYGKESAFNRLAIGNKYGAIQAYGIPQLKNPSIAYLSAVEQVDAGIDYIEHRYGTPCVAYAHYIDRGWH
jgi:hypothetical protein